MKPARPRLVQRRTRSAAARSEQLLPADAGSRKGTYTRGIERRQTLLRAVLRLIARSGVGEVTHRAVADEAGVSLRATTYYFDSKDTMIREALRFYAAANIARADAVAEQFPSCKGKLDAAVDAVARVMVEELANPAEQLAAEYELILAIARVPAYAPEYEQMQRMLELRLRAMMSAIGSASPRQHARLVLAATRGLQVEHLSNPTRPLSERTLRTLLRALILSLVPGSDAQRF